MSGLCRYALLALLPVSFVTGLRAQSVLQGGEVPLRFSATEAQFKHLGVDAGLPENTIYTMLQDTLGFLWFGTANGLVRYDGRETTVYRYDPDDPYSFKGRRVSALHEDRSGDLWIATRANGLVHYDREMGRFTSYVNDPGDETSLSENKVRYLYEDRQGGIWVVTNGGNLDRFDRATGTFTRFRHYPADPTTLGSDRVGMIPEQFGRSEPPLAEDAAGTLWVGTADGLSRFDPETESFTTYRFALEGASNVGPNWIVHIEPSRDGTLWLSTRSDGLRRFDPQTETFTEYRHDPEDPHSLSSNSPLAVYEDRVGALWVMPGRDRGLDRFDPETETFIHDTPDPGRPGSPSDGILLPQHEDANGIWFFNDGNKVDYYDRAADAFTEISFGPDPLSFLEDRSGTVWVATASGGGGVSKLDRTIQFPKVTYEEGNPDGLSDFHIGALYEAPSEPGVLWIGTERGLNRLDRATGLITHYRHDPRDPRSLSGDTVRVVIEDHARRLWVGTTRGLNRMDRRTGTFTQYHFDKHDAGSLLFDWVTALCATRDGMLWVGTNRGLDRFDPEAETFTHYTAALDTTYRPDLYHAFEALAAQRPPIASILRPGTGSSQRTEPFVVEERTQVFIVAQGQFGNVSGLPLDHGWVEDEAGTVVWRMTLADSRHAGGAELYRAEVALLTLEPGRYRLGYAWSENFGYGDWGPPVLDHPELWGIQALRVTPAEAATFEELLTKTDTNRLSDNDINALYEDRDGGLWIGTQRGGLNRLDPATDTFTVYFDQLTGPVNVTSIYQDHAGRLWMGDYVEGLYRIDPSTGPVAHYTTAGGLPGNTVLSILEDDQGYLWIGVPGRGVSRFDPEAEVLRNYDQSLTNGANGVVHKSADGTLIFGSYGYVTFVDPSRLADDPHPPEVALTGFDLFNEPAEIGLQAPLRRDISVAERLTLAHDQNDFTLHFAALHYASPEENTVRYRLEPYDGDWVEAGAARQARYTNLSPGRYTFRVIAANPDGVWNQEGRSLQITILPPWWRTWWAYAVYGLLVLGGVFVADRWQRRRLVAREREAARERELEQAKEIERAYTQLKATQAQLIQSEKMASLGQLTAGIAHEIKNPLNFINNFAEVNQELAQELREALHSGEDLEAILADLEQNAGVIALHGKRADGIVQSMMQHASGGTGQREPTDVNALVSEYVDLAYHGKRAQVPDLSVEIQRDLSAEVGRVALVPQEIGRVVLNLLSNAFDAVQARAQAINGQYAPTVTVSTRRVGDDVEVRVEDNGVGIPAGVQERIFEPFYTTKPAGSGTGLGLSLSYDIVTQGHGGTLTVESKEGQGAAFVVTLPVHGRDIPAVQGRKM